MDEDRFDDFDMSKLSPEAATMFGIVKKCRNLNEGQSIVLEFTNGKEISGQKTFFDDEACILGVRVEKPIPKVSKITNQTEYDYVTMHFAYRINYIVGIGTFPNVKK